MGALIADVGALDDDTFYDEDGNFDEEKYDLYRDIVRESYAQQMKRLKASTRLLKRLRKDKTRIELPKLPGWQYLPGDRRIWTDPHAVSAEVAYPKDGFVSQGGPQSVFGFGCTDVHYHTIIPSPTLETILLYCLQRWRVQAAATGGQRGQRGEVGSGGLLHLQ